MKTGWIWALLVLLTAAKAYCEPVLQNNRAELNLRAQKLRNVVLLSPDTRISEVSAGGVREHRADWSDTGRIYLEKAIIKNLAEQGINVKVLKVPAELESEADEIKILYRAVISSIYTHAYYWSGRNPNFFPDRMKIFDYTVGSLDRLLNEQKADGLLLVLAEDEISTSGRKALLVVEVINPLGTKGRAGTTTAVIALADRKGDILWDNVFSRSGGYDLRDPESATSFVNVLLDGFPLERR